MTEKCKNETFLKAMWDSGKSCSFKNANLYLLESVCLAKCCFGMNLIDGLTFEKIHMKPMRWMIKNINLRCIFILFYFIFDTSMKKCACFLFSPLTLLLKLRVSYVPTRNWTLLVLEYKTIFLQECLNFLAPQILWTFPI